VIAGERPPRQAGERLYQQVEIEYGPFRRVVDLGGDLDAERARATYENGILQIEIPLADAASSARQVPIQAGRREDPGPPEAGRS
jgi:HSP20 family protein